MALTCILNLGIYILISNCSDIIGKNESEMNKMFSSIFENLNLSFNKAEKDIGIYKSTISKMEQARIAVNNLDNDFRSHLTGNSGPMIDAYDAIQQVVPLLKVEMFGVLQVNYSELRF